MSEHAHGNEVDARLGISPHVLQANAAGTFERDATAVFDHIRLYASFDRATHVLDGHVVEQDGFAAVGQDGSVYFGIGSENFGNAYLLDKEGKAHYDLKGERGTIQRILPDFRSRETVATGVRFPVALAFNRRGDLFATDQEGATWLPNGNPLDELEGGGRGIELDP